VHLCSHAWHGPYTALLVADNGGLTMPQAQLYDTCAIDELVTAALDGIHCTVFAFGQTGSGKVREDDRLTMPSRGQG